MKCSLPVKKKRKILLPTFHKIPIPRKTKFFSTSWLFFLDSMVLWHFSFVFVLFYLPYLSSIHEKANCIAILWTGSPHSLGSCLFRGLWATCLPHKGGGILLSALPKDTASELAGLFSTTSPKCRAPTREAADAIFLKSFGMTRQGE